MSDPTSQPGLPSASTEPRSETAPIEKGDSGQKPQGPSLDQLNPLIPAAEQKRMMYGALAFWILISGFVVWQRYLLEVPPVRMVVTLLLALPIAVFWFIFWPQKLVAQIAPSPYVQVPILLGGPIVFFLGRADPTSSPPNALDKRLQVSSAPSAPESPSRARSSRERPPVTCERRNVGTIRGVALQPRFEAQSPLRVPSSSAFRRCRGAGGSAVISD
jgi:hypothetical protein